MPNPNRPSTYARLPNLPSVIRQEQSEDFGFLVSDADLTKDDREAMVKLVMLLMSPQDVARYRTWKARARALGIPEDKVFLYRRTPQYQRILKEAVRTRALEATAVNQGNMEAIAQTVPSEVTAAESVSASKLTAEIAGAKEATQQNINVQHITLEGHLRDLLKQAVTVEARVLDE